jgi:hypothetical protein
MQLRKAELIFGTITKPDKIRRLPVHTCKGDELPENIKELYIKDKPWELEGLYGDPRSAVPVQYHRLRIFREDRAYRIEFFNLATSMFFDENTEELRRIFRCLFQLEREVK